MPAPYKIRLTRQAVDDIDEIHQFIAQNSRRTAAGVIERLFDEFDKLENFPHRSVVEYLSDKLDYPVRRVSVRPMSFTSEWTKRKGPSLFDTFVTGPGCHLPSPIWQINR